MPEAEIFRNIFFIEHLRWLPLKAYYSAHDYHTASFFFHIKSVRSYLIGPQMYAFGKARRNQVNQEINLVNTFTMT